MDDAAHAALLDTARDGLVMVDRTWCILFCSPAAAERLGWALPVDGEDFWKRSGRLFDAAGRSRVRRNLASGRPAELVARPRAREWRYLKFLPCATGVAILLRNATRQIRSEVSARRDQERLRELNESLRLAHRAAHAASWEWRLGDALRWTDLQAAGALIGIPASWKGEGVITDWMALVLDEDKEPVRRSLLHIAERGEGQVEFRVRGADGAVHWLQASAIVADRDAVGAATRLVGVTIDITGQKAAEEALHAEVQERRAAERRQRLLVMELNHRVKNTLATVQSIARQTLRRAPELKPVFEDFEARLLALSWAHDVLTAEGWAGADLGDLIGKTIRPHQSGAGGRLSCDGPPVRLSPQTSLAVAMALHELATNAVKYGALGVEGGRVHVGWRVEDQDGRRRLRLVWRESGGPPVRPPERTGFGTRLLRQGLSAELGEPVELRFERDGLVCVLHALLKSA